MMLFSGHEHGMLFPGEESRLVRTAMLHIKTDVACVRPRGGGAAAALACATRRPDPCTRAHSAKASLSSSVQLSRDAEVLSAVRLAIMG
jgi:hypothetical protein